MFKKILFATDNSAHSERAIHQLIDLAKSNDAEVIVFNAYYIPEYLRKNDGSSHYIDLDKMEKNLIEHGIKVVDEVKSKLEEQQIKVTTAIGNGPAGKAIVEKVTKDQCDLVIVGTRGLGNTTIISSVSNYVIHHATCSVLLVH